MVQYSGIKSRDMKYFAPLNMEGPIGWADAVGKTVAAIH